MHTSFLSGFDIQLSFWPPFYQPSTQKSFLFSPSWVVICLCSGEFARRNITKQALKQRLLEEQDEQQKTRLLGNQSSMA